VVRRPCPGIRVLDAWRAALEARAAEVAEQARGGDRDAHSLLQRRYRVDPAVRTALAQAAGGRAPELVCFAGHDAGVLAERLPAGMIFVRNASGISHSPDEHVELSDAAAAARSCWRALEQLAG
jgi:N-carbamoyl-L-amino-acid hydrolase